MGESWLVLVKGAEVTGWGRAGYVGCLALRSGVTGNGMMWGPVFRCSEGHELLANTRVGVRTGFGKSTRKQQTQTHRATQKQATRHSAVMYVIHTHTHKLISTDMHAATDTTAGETTATQTNKYKYIYSTPVKSRKSEEITAHPAN